LRSQKLTKVHLHKIKNRLDIIYRTYLKLQKLITNLEKSEGFQLIYLNICTDGEKLCGNFFDK
jgi:hypothetical protein